MKYRTFKVGMVGSLVAASLWLAGCGSSSTTNQILVSVTPSATGLIAGQQQSFTATVTGSTVLTVTWKCTWTISTTDQTTGKTTTQTGDCNDPKYGTTNITANVIVYTAPTLAVFPNPVPQITLTATADADNKKTGTAIILLDSGIRVSVVPTTVTVPVPVNPAQTVAFKASFLNIPPTGGVWLVTQPDSGSTNTNNHTANPLGASCSPGCGTIDKDTGVYTAPAALPTDTTPPGSKSTTPTTVYVVVNSSQDPNHFATAIITLINASTHPVTFDSMSPTVVAAGAVEQDVYLNAHNLLNTTTINFIAPDGTTTALDSSQVFTIPITAAFCTPSASGVTPVVTCDASILTRVRLNASQLAVPGKAFISISGIPDPNSAGQTITISQELDLVYASPGLVAAVPDSFPQGTDTSLRANGGFYGGGSRPIVALQFNGNPNITVNGTARQVTGPLQGSQIQNPGLYPVSMHSTADQSVPAPFNPPMFPTVTTNIAVQPTFAALNPPSLPPNIPMPGGANAVPSSMVINSEREYALITEQGSGFLRVLDISTTPPHFTNSLQLSCTANAAPVNCQPTSVAFTSTLNYGAGQDTAVIVNSADQSLSLVAVPNATPIAKVNLSSLVTAAPGTTVAPPFSVGVDPTTNLAVVAYSNTNVGFIVDLRTYDQQNPQPVPCFVATQQAPCAIASVSLNTGPTPQVVMQPGVPLAYVTPGGGGLTSVVNLLQLNNTVPIAAAPSGVVRTNNIATVITSSPHGINPGVGGTVLIAGVTPADLNGTYQVNPGSVINPFTFSYTQTGTLANENGGGGTVQYGNPYYTFSTTPTATGAAINPVTRTFGYADYNPSSSQINFIGTLDQNLSSVSLSVGSCNTCTPTQTAPENGFRSVAWDPFTNVLIAYNPQDPFDEVSLINPGGPSATGGNSAGYRISPAIPTGQIGTGTFTPTGATTPVKVFGPMAYDPEKNLVLVANAGSNTLTYLNINPDGQFRKVQVGSVEVTSGGVANAQPPLKSTALPNPPKAVCDPTNPKGAYSTCLPQAVTLGATNAAIKVFGKGFQSGTTVHVRLDGQFTITPAGGGPASIVTTVVSDQEVNATIPAAFLTVPHDYALDVLVDSSNSNTTDLQVVGVQDLSAACTTEPAQPEGAAIDDILRVAVVTNYGCNSISIVNLDATGKLRAQPYGAILASLSVGKGPIGVAVLPRLHLAVTANNLAGPPATASIIDISDPANPKLAVSTDVTVGVAPTGVGMDQDHAYALIANNGSNTLSVIDLTVLEKTPVGTPTALTVAASGPLTAIAVDPNRGIAVVTVLQNSGTTASTGGLDVFNLTTTPPTRSTSSSVSNLTASPTGITYDPAVSPAVFYATSTHSNAIYQFNPDTGSTLQIRVGINPYGVAYNPQTGTLLTVNSGFTPPSDATTTLTQNSGSSSVLDTQTFRTRATLGISSQSQFSAAMDSFTNTVVLVDQNNNRVLFLAMPK
jgi:hypothetical protein